MVGTLVSNVVVKPTTADALCSNRSPTTSRITTPLTYSWWGWRLIRPRIAQPRAAIATQMTSHHFPSHHTGARGARTPIGIAATPNTDMNLCPRRAASRFDNLCTPLAYSPRLV
jgi:hypothetical protein